MPSTLSVWEWGLVPVVSETGQQLEHLRSHRSHPSSVADLCGISCRKGNYGMLSERNPSPKKETEENS